MAQLSDVMRSGLREEDLPPDLAQQLQPLLQFLNTSTRSVSTAVSGNLTLADNLTCDVVTAKFSHGAATTVKLTRVQRAGSALVLLADGQQVIGQPEVSVTGPQQAKVTLYFANTLARDVSVTLVVLPEGPGSKQATTFKTAWTKATLATGSAYGGGFQDPAYQRDTFGMVRLCGVIAYTGAVGVTLFTLPAGYRPLLRHIFTTWSGSGAGQGACRIDVFLDGTVYLASAPFTGAGGFFSLDGISFLAEQ